MSMNPPLFRIVCLLLAIGSSIRAQAKSYDIGGKVLWPGMRTFRKLVRRVHMCIIYNEMICYVRVQETKLQHQR